MKKVKPMLAVEVDLDKLRYPCIASPKLDGIRCLIKDGVVVSRSLKPIRNKHVQSMFSSLEGFDGELIVGDPVASDVFQKTTSGVMSIEGEPDVTYHVFDKWDVEGSYEDRLFGLCDLPKGCALVQSTWCHNREELLSCYDKYISQGYEGVMVRDPSKPYKFGRATVNSQELLKLKPFVDDEFKVVGFTERMHNSNEAVRNELGNLERSSAKDGLVPTNSLGALIVEYGETTFEVGTGFTDEQRKDIWLNQDDYLGKLVKVRYQEIGILDKPRFPSFQGFRHEDDLCK